MKTNNSADLQVFLKKVLLLRGYGDMDSYKVLTEYRKISDRGVQENLEKIMSDFADPRTYADAKRQLVEAVKFSIEQKKEKNKTDF